MLVKKISIFLLILLFSECIFAKNTNVSHSLNIHESYFIKASKLSKQIDYGKDRVIAVLDTGINDDNIELKGQVIAEYDATSGQKKAIDKNGHGTRIASIIASKKDTVGIDGIAYNAKLIDVKVVEDDGSIKEENIIKGIEFAVKNGANTINMSFTSGGYSKKLESIINRYANKVVFVASAGNEGENSLAYPAAYKNVVAVSSYENGTQKRAIYANYDDTVYAYIQDDIWTYDGKKYKKEIGTSEAAAVVSSYIKSYNPKTINTKSKNKSKKLANSDTTSGLDVFQDSEAKSFLNAQARYLHSLVELEKSRDLFLHYYRLSNYSKSLTGKTIELSTYNKGIIAKLNAHIILLDMFKSYSKQVYTNEFEYFKYDENKISLITNILSELTNKIKDFEGFSDELYEILTTYNDKLMELLKSTKSKTGSTSRLIRRICKTITGNMLSAKAQDYRTSTTYKINQTRVKPLIKYLKIMSVGMQIIKGASDIADVLNQAGDLKKQIAFFRIHGVEFLADLILLENDFRKVDGTITKNFFDLIEENTNDKAKLTKLTKNLFLLGLVQIGANKITDIAIDNIKGKNSIFGNLLLAFDSVGKSIKDIMTGVIMWVIKQDVQEGVSSYMYYIYQDFMYESKKLFNANSQNSKKYIDGYITSTDLIRELMNSIIYRNYVYHSARFVFNVMRNTNSWSPGSFIDSTVQHVLDEDNVKITVDGIKIEYKDVGLFKAAEYTGSMAWQSVAFVPVNAARWLTNASSWTGDALYSITFSKDFEKVHKKEVYIDTFLEKFTADNTVGQIHLFTNKSNALIKKFARFQTVVKAMLESKEIYNAVTSDNQKLDKYKENAINSFLDDYKIDINKRGYPTVYIINKELLFESNKNMCIATEEFFENIKKNKNARRKDYMIALLKAANYNPYDDEEFLKKLFNASINDTNSDSIAKYFSDINSAKDENGNKLTLNEKIWLLYGKYPDRVGLGGNFRIITGYDDGTLKPFRYVTREEAIALVGATVKSLNLGKSYNYESVKSKLDKLKIPLDEFDSISNQSFKENIGKVLLDGIAHGKSIDCQEERTLDLSANLSFFETGVIAYNLQSIVNPKEFPIVTKGDKLDKADSPNCPEPIDMKESSIQSIKTVHENQAETLTYHSGYDGSNLEYINITWEAPIGEITDFKKGVDSAGKIYTSIKYTAPKSNMGEYLLPITISFINNSGKGSVKKEYVKVLPEGESSNTDSVYDDSDSKVQLQTSYSKNTNKFDVSWKAISSGRLEVKYSFDKINWTRYGLVTVGNYQGNSISKVINGTDVYNTIYFKTILTVGSQKYYSGIKTLNYETKSDTYVEKGTEIPKRPTLYSIGDSTNNNYVSLQWKRVNDSHHNDNVSYYEIMYADNNNFNNAQVINAGNNAAGENIYESCSYRISNLEDDTKYYFKIRATNNLGTSDWSSYRSIYINLEDLPFFDTDYQYPRNEEFGTSKRPTLKWRAYDKDGDDLDYYISIGESPNNLNKTLRAFGVDDSNFYSFENYYEDLKPNTTYYWQVKVREQGKYKNDYGGEYIKSPIWNFKTVNVGKDLAIIDAKLVSELKPAKKAVFELTIKNLGNETATAEWIQAYYKKNSKTTQFNNGSGRMTKNLAPGESEVIRITVSFRDNVIEPNSYNGYKERDNVLIEGDSYVIFKFSEVAMEDDMESSNNSKEVMITYNNQGKPVIDFFAVGPYGVYNGEYDFPLYTRLGESVGRLSGIQFRAEDDIKITKATIEYRKNSDDSWHLIKTINNNENFIKVDYDWNIPIDTSFITDSFQIRVKVYENENSYSERVSYPYSIYSNRLNMLNLKSDKLSYKVGDDLMLSYTLDSDYPVRLFIVKFKTQNKTEELYYKFMPNGGDIENNIEVQIPNNNNYAYNNSRIEVFITDIHGNTKTIESNKFNINPNTSLPKPFKNFIEISKQLNTNFPTNQNIISKESFNDIKALKMDNNNIVHVIIASVAQYSLKDDYNVYNNVDYLYITHNPKTNYISNPIKILSTNQYLGDNSGLYLRDFILLNNLPYILFGDEKTGNFYITKKNNNTFTDKTLVLNKNMPINISFFHVNSELFITWVEKIDAQNRQNKYKKIFPIIKEEELFSDFYLGGNIRVHDKYLFANCGKLYELNSQLDIVNTLYDSEDTCCGGNEHYANFSNNSSIIEIASLGTSKEMKLKIIKNDLSTETINDATSYNNIAVFDDVILYAGTKEIGKCRVSLYDILKKQSVDFFVGTVFRDTKLVSINKNKYIALGNIKGNKTYITTADFSQNFQGPKVNITSKNDFIEKNSSFNLQWNVESNVSDILKYEIYQVVDSQETLLETITNSETTSYLYEYDPIINSSEVTLKIVAYDNSDNNSIETIHLNIVNQVIFNSFTLDKTSVNVGDEITFNWSTENGQSNTHYTIYKQNAEKGEWDKLSKVVGATTFSYKIKDFSGDYNFKIVSGNSEKTLSSSLKITGEYLSFIKEKFSPSGFYNGLNNIRLNWDDTLQSAHVKYQIYVKKDGDPNFVNIGNTFDKFYIYDSDGSSFTWKVSAILNGNTVFSDEHKVFFSTLEAPKIISTKLNMINNQPQAEIVFSSIENAKQYQIIKKENGKISENIKTDSTTYIDHKISYGYNYTYSVKSINGNYESDMSDEKSIIASLDEKYNIIIDTADNQKLISNDLTIVFHTTKEPIYKSYEILLGTDPDNLLQYTITNKKSLDISGLDYATMYFVEIYPVDYSGVRISTVPAKLTFTTGFDNRTIDGNIEVNYTEVSTDYVSIKWNAVENADSYKICRSENGGAYDCFTSTSNNYFTDNVNIIPGNSYTYIVKAENSNSVKASNPTYKVYISNPNEDRDGDGILDGNDQNLNDGPNADPDGDGKVNSVDFDDDNDGMLDTCESKYPDYLNQWADDADMDADSDGYTNLQECQGGSDPTDDTSYPSGTTSNMVPILMYLLDSGGSTSSSNKDTTQIPIIMYLLN